MAECKALTESAVKGLKLERPLAAGRLARLTADLHPGGYRCRLLTNRAVKRFKHLKNKK